MQEKIEENNVRAADCCRWCVFFNTEGKSRCTLLDISAYMTDICDRFVGIVDAPSVRSQLKPRKQLEISPLLLQKWHEMTESNAHSERLADIAKWFNRIHPSDETLDVLHGLEEVVKIHNERNGMNCGLDAIRHNLANHLYALIASDSWEVCKQIKAN